MSGLFPSYQKFCLETLKNANAITDLHSHFVLFDEYSTHPTWFAFIKNTNPTLDDVAYWRPVVNLYDKYMIACEIVDLHLNKDTLLYQKQIKELGGSYLVDASLEKIQKWNEIPEGNYSLFKNELFDLVDANTVHKLLAHPMSNDEIFIQKQLQFLPKLFPSGLVDHRTRTVAWGLLNLIYYDHKIAFPSAIILPFGKNPGKCIKQIVSSDSFDSLQDMQDQFASDNHTSYVDVLGSHNYVMLRHNTFDVYPMSYDPSDNTFNIHRGTCARLDKLYTIALFLYAYNMCNAKQNYFSYRTKNPDMLYEWTSDPIVYVLCKFYGIAQYSGDTYSDEDINSYAVVKKSEKQFMALFIQTLLLLTNFKNKEILTQFTSMNGFLKCITVEKDQDEYQYYDIETVYEDPKTKHYIKLANYDDLTYARHTNIVDEPPLKNYYKHKEIITKLISQEGTVKCSLFKVLAKEAGVTQSEVMYSFVEDHIAPKLHLLNISTEEALELLFQRDLTIQDMVKSSKNIKITELENILETCLKHAENVMNLTDGISYDPEANEILNSTTETRSVHLNAPEILEFLQQDNLITVYSVMCVAENAYFEDQISQWKNVKANRMETAKSFHTLLQINHEIFNCLKEIFGSNGSLATCSLEDNMNNVEEIFKKYADVSKDRLIGSVVSDTAEKNVAYRVNYNYYIITDVDGLVYFACGNFEIFYTQDEIIGYVLDEKSSAQKQISNNILADTEAIAWLFYIMIELNYHNKPCAYNLDDIMAFFLKDLHTASRNYCNKEIINADNIYVISEEGVNIIKYFLQSEIFLNSVATVVNNDDDQVHNQEIDTSNILDTKNYNDTVDFKTFLLQYIRDNYSSVDVKMEYADHYFENAYVLIINRKLELIVYNSIDYIDVEISIMAQLCFLSHQIGYTFVCLNEKNENFTHLALIMTVDADMSLERILNKEYKPSYSSNKISPGETHSSDFSKCLENILNARRRSQDNRLLAHDFRRVFEEFYKIFYFHCIKNASNLNISLQYMQVNPIKWSHLPLTKYTAIGPDVIMYMVDFTTFNKVFCLNQTYPNYFDDVISSIIPVVTHQNVYQTGSSTPLKGIKSSKHLSLMSGVSPSPIKRHSLI